jgi:hypothetical protein
MTDQRITQASLEQWASTIPPDMRLTQIAIEMWASTGTTTVQMLATQAAIEHWATVREASRGGPMISMIM